MLLLTKAQKKDKVREVVLRSLRCTSLPLYMGGATEPNVLMGMLHTVLPGILAGAAIALDANLDADTLDKERALLQKAMDQEFALWMIWIITEVASDTTSSTDEETSNTPERAVDTDPVGGLH